MEIIERNIVHPDKVRALCIKENWYTCGTNEEYSKMLAHCRVTGRGKQDQFLKDLFEVASDIYNHSEIDLTMTGSTELEYISDIMYAISNECISRVYYVDELEV